MHGIVDLGTVSAGFARAQVTAGRWQRVHPAVFCTYTGPLTMESRCEAALRHAGRGAALDAGTAALLHGLAGFERDEVELVIPHDRRIDRQPGLLVRRSRTLTEAAVRSRRGLRVVTVERAVIAVGPPATTAAVQQGLTTSARLRDCLAELGNVRRRRTILETLDDLDGGSRSWLEARFARLLREAGLPAPARNHPLLAGGRRVRIDACYPAERVAIELDGRAYHLLGDDWERDLARQNLLVLDGWTVLRFTSRDLRERPGAVVEAVRRALGRISVARAAEILPGTTAAR